MEVGKGGRRKEDTCNYVKKKKIMRLCRTAKRGVCPEGMQSRKQSRGYEF